MSELIVPPTDRRIFIGIEIKKSQAHLYWNQVSSLVKNPPPVQKVVMTLDGKNFALSLKAQPIEAVHRKGDTISVFTKRYHLQLTAILEDDEAEAIK